MSIAYIKNSDKTQSIAAAEKIKISYINEQKKNPWLHTRLNPIQSEAFVKGGGTYKFKSILGEDAATRRTGYPTNSTVNYDGSIANKEVTLTITQPFMTKAYPMVTSDIVQLDGIDYSSIIADQITQSLVAAEILSETAAITTNTDILTLDKSSITSDFDKLKELKRVGSNYKAINDKTPDWKSATTATKAYSYFTAQNGSLLKNEVKIHMHPADYTDLSNAITDKGAGSDGQYKEFTNAEMPIIGGISVIENKYITRGEVYFVPNGINGVPDADNLTTKVKTWDDGGNDVQAMKGWHWFNNTVVNPELVTKVSFNVLEKSNKSSVVVE